MELAGSWVGRGNELTTGTGLPVDFTGIPLNEEGRLRALTYNESQLGMIERQCQGWPASYLVMGPFGLRIWSELDPVRGTVRSWTIGAWEDKPIMTIWMDGRPHPSEYDLHTRSGFTTGRWEGTTLVARTTHMKEGLLRRVGAPVSDRATMTTRLTRHGDFLAVLVIIEDPDLPGRAVAGVQDVSSEPDRSARHRPAVHHDVRGRGPGCRRPPLPARKEPVRGRADEEIRRAPRRDHRHA